MHWPLALRKCIGVLITNKVESMYHNVMWILEKVHNQIHKPAKTPPGGHPTSLWRSISMRVSPFLVCGGRLQDQAYVYQGSKSET